MTVTEIKHAAKRQEWQERIMECRSSGESVKRWCAERQICTTTYYRWEREIFGQLVKKEKGNQALAVAEFAAVPATAPRGASGQAIITLRTGAAEADIYAGAGEREIEAVLRALKLC